MANLNLPEQFAQETLRKEPAVVRAGNVRPWRLEVPTNSRAELIGLSIFLARALPSDFLHDIRNPMTIQLSGTYKSGKSMIVEAMMKTMLDNADAHGMLKPDAPKEMFLEQFPAQASLNYVYATGTHNGTPVLYAFDRISDGIEYYLNYQFREAAATAIPAPAGGAIFFEAAGYNEQWLTLDLKRRHSRESDPAWDRTTTITVESDELKNDPQFNLYWNRLRAIAETGDLTPLPDRAFVRTNPSLSSPASLQAVLQ